MRWILYLVVALLALGVLVAVVGALLPKAHSVSRTVRIALAPDAVYAILVDVSQYRAWRPTVTAFERLPDKAGRPAWIEESNGSKIPMTFDRMEAPSLLVARIDSRDLPFGGTWTYRISPAPGGSDLTITEDGEVSNVIFRFMSRFVFGHTATMDTFLAQLQARVAAGKA